MLNQRVTFTSRAKEVQARVKRGQKRGLFFAANDLRNKAMVLAPVKTGFLMNYITVIVGPDQGVVTGGTRDQQRQETVSVPEGSAVVGSAANYARAVHETHATHSKFLETPARNNANAYKQQIIEELRKAVGS